MEPDPCHELMVARARLSEIEHQRMKLRDDQSIERQRLRILKAGIKAEIEWWTPRCKSELRREEDA